MKTASYMTEAQQEMFVRVNKRWAEIAVDEGMDAAEVLNALAMAMCGVVARDGELPEVGAQKIRDLVEGWVGIYQRTINAPADFVEH